VNRTEKSALVDELRVTLGRSNVIVASFRGMSANLADDLRRKVRLTGGTYRVIQNRLARRAAEGTPSAPLGQRFRGPCAIVAHDTDPIALAKVLTEFAKAHPQLEVLAGVIDAADVAEAPTIRALATMPALPQLRAQLLALVQTPGTMLVRLVHTPATQLARVVSARVDSMASGSPEG
jgi:large subunit ribosomal protein L10